MTEKQQVLDKLSYWWASLVHAFWWLGSVLLYGKSDVEGLQRASIKKKAAKMRVLKHELNRAARKEGPSVADVENTSDLQNEVTTITQEMKAIRDTGPHRVSDNVTRKVSSA